MKNQHQLTRFLTRDESYFEHSTFGAQIEQIIRLAYGGRECPKCAGLGILDEPWVLDRDHNGDPCAPVELPTGKECGICKGVGYTPVRFHQSETITVRPTHTTEHTVKEAPPDAVLLNYAVVSRRLQAIGKRLAAVLVSAYGDEGEAYSGEARGRSWSVTPLTAAGRTLIQGLRESRASKETIDPWRGVEAMNALARKEAAKTDKARSELLAKAIRDARKLLDEAEKAWDDQCEEG